ncbi:MAG: hypothetical protein M1839_002367 [Geoglossum umbratile]|nr:MAG: hypothetical protein M1839_002367 [Geoglossum umbratile]
MADNNGDKIREYLSFLDGEVKKNTYVPFNIKASRPYTEPEKLFDELESKGLPRSHVGRVEMLDSESSWHITVRRSHVELFRKICPGQITSGDVEEVEGLVAEMKV